MNWTTPKLVGLILGGLIVLCIVIAFVGCSAVGITTEPVHGYVIDHYVKRADKHDKYMITVQKDDGSVEVFEDTDAALHGKFNSADVNAQAVLAQQQHTHVRLSVTGYRSGLNSSFRNVVSITPEPQ